MTGIIFKHFPLTDQILGG